LEYTIKVTNNRNLEIKNKFNQMRSTIKRILNNKARKDTQIKLYKAMAVPILTYGSEFWTVTKQQEAKTETAEMRFLKRVPDYTRKDQINTTIGKNRIF
jgi:hypothetical protein